MHDKPSICRCDWRQSHLLGLAEPYRSGAHILTDSAMTPTFPIRKLFVVVALCAVSALMVRTSDWIAAVGFGLSATVLMFAIECPAALLGARLNRGIRYVALLFAVAIAWFSIVDFSRSYEWCAHCSDHRFIDEFRIFGIPVSWKHSDFHIDNASRLRTDLGMRCQHRFAREHLVRAWGLVYCARPCIGITCCFSGDADYYSDDVSVRARQFAAQNPEEAVELCERVINKKDYDSMHAFIARMKESETVDGDSRFSAPEQTDEREPE